MSECMPRGERSNDSGHDSSGHDNNGHDVSGRAEALRHAEAGAAGWRAAARAQQAATPDHGEFYELAGLLVETFYAVQALAGVLARQVAGYPDTVAAGEAVYDDTRTLSPVTRLEMAVSDLHALAQSTGMAGRDANLFWSSIGHIGVEEVTR